MHSAAVQVRKGNVRTVRRPPAGVMTLWRAIWNGIETGRLDEASAAASRLPSPKEAREAHALIEARRPRMAVQDFIAPAAQLHAVPRAAAKARACTSQCLSSAEQHLQILFALVNMASCGEVGKAHALFKGLSCPDQGVILVTLLGFNPRCVRERGYPEAVAQVIAERRARFWTEFALELYRRVRK